MSNDYHATLPQQPKEPTIQEMLQNTANVSNSNYQKASAFLDSVRDYFIGNSQLASDTVNRLVREIQIKDAKIKELEEFKASIISPDLGNDIVEEKVDS